MRGGSFIHSIHFPVLRNTIMRKMKTGMRTGIGSPPWMQTETSGPEISCGMWRSVPSQPWSPNFPCNQSIARDIPKSKRKPSNGCKHVSRKDSKNTNVTYALLATSCVGPKELKPSQASPQRWLVGKQGWHVLPTANGWHGNAQSIMFWIHAESTVPPWKTLLHVSGKFGETNPQSQNEIYWTGQNGRQRLRLPLMKQLYNQSLWTLCFVSVYHWRTNTGCRQMWVSQQSQESGKKTKSSIEQNSSVPRSRVCMCLGQHVGFGT